MQCNIYASDSATIASVQETCIPTRYTRTHGGDRSSIHVHRLHIHFNGGRRCSVAIGRCRQRSGEPRRVYCHVRHHCTPRTGHQCRAWLSSIGSKTAPCRQGDPAYMYGPFSARHASCLFAPTRRVILLSNISMQGYVSFFWVSQTQMRACSNRFTCESGLLTEAICDQMAFHSQRCSVIPHVNCFAAEESGSGAPDSLCQTPLLLVKQLPSGIWEYNPEQ